MDHKTIPPKSPLSEEAGFESGFFPPEATPIFFFLDDHSYKSIIVN